MSTRSWIAVVAGMAVAVAVASPAFAQGKGNGGGNKPPKTACDENSYTVTVTFDLPPDLQTPSEENPWVEPPIQPAGSDWTVALETTLSYGRVQGYFQHPDSGHDEAPIEVDFSNSGDDLYDGWPSTVDPRLTVIAYDDLGALSEPECGMFGMLPLDAHPDAPAYYGRTGFRWTVDGQLWTLRHKPEDTFGNIPTHADIVRINANTWVVTSRADSLHPSPPAGCGDPCYLPHFMSLEKYGSGRGKDAQEKIFTTPVMPIQLTIVVNCGEGVDCPAPNGTQ